MKKQKILYILHSIELILFASYSQFHNHDFYCKCDCDILGSRIVICQNSHSCSGLHTILRHITSCTLHVHNYFISLTLTCSCNLNNSSLSCSTCCCRRSSDDWKYQVTPNSRTRLTSDSTKLTANTTSLLRAAITTTVYYCNWPATINITCNNHLAQSAV